MEEHNIIPQYNTDDRYTLILANLSHKYVAIMKHKCIGKGVMSQYMTLLISKLINKRMPLHPFTLKHPGDYKISYQVTAAKFLSTYNLEELLYGGPIILRTYKFEHPTS